MEQTEKIDEPVDNNANSSTSQYSQSERAQHKRTTSKNGTVANTLVDEQLAYNKDEEAEDDRILFTDTTSANHSKLKRRGPLMESKVSHVFSTLGESLRKMSTVVNSKLAEKLLEPSETYGNFITWMPEPSLPSRYSGSIEMPSRQIQFTLIDRFFQERYHTLCLFPRFYFYEQLESKGLLITPLLLNAMYAHATRSVPNIPDCPKSDIFYHRAKRLVDDFLDVPRVSTVIALYLLSLYEPSPSIYRPGSQHCRQWQYSGMACRMALELGLHDDSHLHPSLSATEIELRRRVFWCCYELDKHQSAGWERPWMISQTMVKTKDPSPLAEENDQDLIILNQLLARIHLTYHFEETLILLSAFREIEKKKNADDIYCKFGMKKEEIYTKWAKNHKTYTKWLNSLPPELQWTPTTSVSIGELMEKPLPDPIVAYVHVIYNTMILDVLPHLRDKNMVATQSQIAATCITQLVYSLLQHIPKVNKFDTLAHSLMQAIKIHIHYLDNTDVEVAQKAWILFDRSVYCIQFLSNYAVIPNCNRFLQQVQSVYGTDIAQERSKTLGSKRSLSPPPKSIALTKPTNKGKERQDSSVQFSPLTTYWQPESSNNDLLQLQNDNSRIYLEQEYRFQHSNSNTNQLYPSYRHNQNQPRNHNNVFPEDLAIHSHLFTDKPNEGQAGNYPPGSNSSNYIMSESSNILWQEENVANHINRK